MNVLQLTVHFSPNLGGVETHLDDLVSGLVNENHRVFVLTYRPLSVSTGWNIWTSRPRLSILRLPWIPGFFNKLSSHPFWEFLYLFIGLFIALPFVILFFNPQVIHAHGVVAGFVGVFWAKIFRRRVIISTHSLYHFPQSGAYYKFTKWIFSSSDKVLCLSDQSRREIIHLGVNSDRIGRFTYWIDLVKFHPLSKNESKSKLGWQGKFTVLFVGRLVPEKGIPELLQAAPYFHSGIDLKIAGSGPLLDQVKSYYVGRISQSELPLYYSAADLVIVPSTHDEGFGRVIIESLACGTPVVAANRGAIPEAMDDSVGKLITITPENITLTINDFYQHPQLLVKLAKQTRSFATQFYSPANIIQITSLYE